MTDEEPDGAKGGRKRAKPVPVVYQHNATGQTLELYNDPNDITYQIISGDNGYAYLGTLDEIKNPKPDDKTQ